MSNRTIALTDALYDYLLGISLREPPLLRELREETAALPTHGMQISPDQGQFMALLARLVGAKQCIEVGVYTGYSSLVTALALPDNGRIVACDVSEEWTAIARRYWQRGGVAHKIELQLAPARETLDGLIASGQAGQYDLAFIDADKVSYRDYYERCLLLLRSGGLIVVDNTLWDGKVANRQVTDTDTVTLRQFNEKLRSDERIDLSLLPVGDGLTLARKR
jgi:predicted O-methyltransferase YrrM